MANTLSNQKKTKTNISKKGYWGLPKSLYKTSIIFSPKSSCIERIKGRKWAILIF